MTFGGQIGFSEILPGRSAKHAKNLKNINFRAL
jgi:hypothetical protein